MKMPKRKDWSLYTSDYEENVTAFEKLGCPQRTPVFSDLFLFDFFPIILVRLAVIVTRSSQLSQADAGTTDHRPLWSG